MRRWEADRDVCRFGGREPIRPEPVRGGSPVRTPRRLVVTHFEFAIEPFLSIHRKATIKASTPIVTAGQLGRSIPMYDPQPRVCQFDGIRHIIATVRTLNNATDNRKAAVPARRL